MSGKISRHKIVDAVVDRLTDIEVKGKTDHAALMRELAAFLVAHNMTADAGMILNDVAHELFVRTGQLTVEITSAHNLNSEVRSHLRGFLRQQTGASTVDMRETVDADLLGGIVARTATSELDASVRLKLRQLTALA